MSFYGGYYMSVCHAIDNGLVIKLSLSSYCPVIAY